MRTIQRTRRNTNRAWGWDYAQPGWYYVTVCTHELRPLFGEVVDGEVRLNDFGRIIEDEWFRTTSLRSDVDLDAFVIMPNHFHGIIVIHEAEELVRATRRVARTQGGRSSLGAIVGHIKAASTKRINALRGTPGATVWHRNYYDHIIRNERDLERIRTYIANNPMNWPFDRAYRMEAQVL